MTMVVNKTEHAIHIGGVMLSPGVPGELPEDFTDNEQVKEMFKNDELEIYKEEAPTPQQTVAAKPATATPVPTTKGS